MSPLLLPCLFWHLLGLASDPVTSDPATTDPVAKDSDSMDLVEAPGWAEMVRIVDDSVLGVVCRNQPDPKGAELARLHFKLPLTQIDARHGWVQLQSESGPCWVPQASVKPVHTSPVYCLKQAPTQILVPIQTLLGRPAPDRETGQAAGTFYPTFYQVALEGYYPLLPGEKPIPVRDEKGRELAKVSEAFRKALLMQGTASLNDGTVLNVASEVAGERRFVALPPGHFGLGIKGFRLYPYRSVALDFDWLCDQLKSSGCTPGNVTKRDKSATKANREALVGTLLYVPRLAGAKIGDTTHDGFVCAVDVGGGIKNDRIDLFVGTDPAGNPFYPACRRDNPHILNGVASLIGADWYHWERNKKGDYERVQPTEYRQTAPSKGLEIIAFPTVRCAKSL